MGRKLTDWLHAYMDYTKHSEPPYSYHLWIGISILAAALQRKVYMPWHMHRLHPNLFIILVGPSGKCRKGTALDFGRDIVRQVPAISMIAQRTTTEQLIRDMKNSLQEYTDDITGEIGVHCSMSVMSGELAVFLGSGNIDFLALLTNLYDSEDEWEYRTKHQGKEKIKGVCLNFIGGSAPDWIRTMIPEAALGGGFTSRFIWVVEWNKSKVITDPTPTKRMWALRDMLIEDLSRIHLMTGAMHFEIQAQEYYDQWYKDTENNPPTQLLGSKFDGYLARRPTNVRKLSMILSASRSNENLIRLEDLQRAIKLLELVEQKMPQAFKGLGTAPYTEISEKCFSYMHEVDRPVSHSELLNAFFPNVNDYSLDLAMRTLIQMKVVRISGLNMSAGVSDKSYELTDIGKKGGLRV